MNVETLKRAFQLYVLSLEALSIALQDKENLPAISLELCRNKVKYNYDQVRLCLYVEESDFDKSELFKNFPSYVSVEEIFGSIFNSGSELTDICSLLKALKSLSCFYKLSLPVSKESLIDKHGNIILPHKVEDEEPEDPEFEEDEEPEDPEFEEDDEFEEDEDYDEDDEFSPLQTVLNDRLLEFYNVLSVAVKSKRMDVSYISQCDSSHSKVVDIMEKLQQNKEHFVDLNRATRDLDTVYVIQDLMVRGCIRHMFDTYKQSEDNFSKYQYELNRMLKASSVARRFFR